MDVAADAAPVGPPWLAITLVCLAALATLVTALMPVIVEKVKQRGAKPPESSSAPTPSTAQAVVRADQALHLIEESMRDLRAQRDDAETEVKRLQRLLGKRESELRRRGWEG